MNNEYTIEALGFRPYKKTFTIQASSADEALDLAYAQIEDEHFDWGQSDMPIQFDEFTSVNPDDFDEEEYEGEVENEA